MRKRIGALGLIVGAFLLTTGCDAGPLGSQAPTIYPVPLSIDTTGAKDVTAELNAFFDSVPDGATIRFPEGATYRIEGTLEIADRHGLTFDGNGARFISDEATPEQYAMHNAQGEPVQYPWRTRMHWSVEGGGAITLRDFTIRGANPNGGQDEVAYVASLEAQHGINIAGVNGILVENVNISYIYGDFVYIGARPVNKESVISRNVTIRGGQWSNNGRQGVGITGVDGATIENIHMSETRRASVDLEPNTSGDVIRNVVIRDSYFGPGRLLWLAAAGSSGTVENITLSGNTLDGRTGSVIIRPPEGSRRRNIRILNNTSNLPGGSGNASNPQPMMQVYRVDGFVAEGNSIPIQEWRGGIGVLCSDCTEVDVEPGQFPGAAADLRVLP